MIKPLTIMLVLLLHTSVQLPHQTNNSDLDVLLRLIKYVNWHDEKEIIVMIATQNTESYVNSSNYLLKTSSTDVNAKIKTVPFDSNADFSDVKIIFIEDISDNDFSKIIANTEGKKIMTFTNNINLMDKGCMFYINNENGKISYYYNKETVIKSGITIKSQVLSPAHDYNQHF